MTFGYIVRGRGRAWQGRTWHGGIDGRRALAGGACMARGTCVAGGMYGGK